MSLLDGTFLSVGDLRYAWKTVCKGYKDRKDNMGDLLKIYGLSTTCSEKVAKNLECISFSWLLKPHGISAQTRQTIKMDSDIS